MTNDITLAELDADLLPERQTMFLNNFGNVTAVAAYNTAVAGAAFNFGSLNVASANQTVLAVS
jgi:hypothetical protein